MQRTILILEIVILMNIASVMIIYEWGAKAQGMGVIWSKQIGTDKDEGAYGIAVDSQGNIYVVGYTEGSMFGTNAGGEDIFIAKYNPEGNLVWGKQFGTPEDEIAFDVATDSDGNIYVVGETMGNLFGRLVRKWYEDVFVMKVSSKGEVVWAKQFGTPGQDLANGVAIDNENKAVYVVGFYSLGEYGDLEAEVFEEETYYEVFVAKYDFEGNKLWEKQYGTKLDDMGNKICIDRDGSVYIVGETTEWFSRRGPGDTDAFVAKLTPDGNLIWGREFGTDGRDYAVDACVDKNNNVYIIGAMNIRETVETMDTFIKKYDSSGNQLWLKEIRIEKEDFEYGIIVDREGNVYIVGYSQGNLFGNNAGGNDIFIAKYSGAGELIWGEMIGTAQDDEGIDIGLDGQGNIYIVGVTEGNLFGANAGGADIFIVKFKR